MRRRCNLATLRWGVAPPQSFTREKCKSKKEELHHYTGMGGKALNLWIADTEADNRAERGSASGPSQ